MSISDEVDLLVIGGGINGAGIARDAAGRGLSVALCEMNDFASATSSASSKLIHGGLRYLEHYEFGLVRKALIEREVLLAAAPHIIKPMRFVLPHHQDLRPAWLLRLGLFLYDYMGGRKVLPSTETVKLATDPRGEALQDQFKKGFEYSDCWVDDARLVILNVMDAANNGAQILKGWRCTSAERQEGVWKVELQSKTGKHQTLRTKALVNASGSWAAELANSFERSGSNRQTLRLVKGSHIVLPQLYDGEHAFTFQESDGRIIFTIPYEKDFTLVGTTDTAFTGDPSNVAIDDEEKQYLCTAVSTYFKKPVSTDQIVWDYSGVRPLVDDGETDASQVTRDYSLKLSTSADEAPLLSVFGGKVTTYRKLAEQALKDLSPWLGGNKQPWTAAAQLPGGDLPGMSRSRFRKMMQAQYDWAEPEMLARLVRQYGTQTTQILGECISEKDLGQYFGNTLYEAELRYLRDREWASTAEDALWRRTKLGLRLTSAEKEMVAAWFNRHRGS